MDGTSPRIDPELLLANAGWLRALARGLVGDDHAADDVVQQTFVAAVEHPPGGGVPLRPWLARVARNFSLRTLRGDDRRAKRDAAIVPPPAPSTPAESAARTEMFREVVDAVLALEPIYRDVVIARFFDGLDMPDAAARLGVPVETARTRLKRAIATLRERLDRKYGDRRAWALLLVPGRRPPVPLRVPRAAPHAAAAVVGGALVMKKILAGAAVVALLVGGWFALAPRGDAPQTATGGGTRPAGTPAPATAPARVRPAQTAAPMPPKPEATPAGPRATGRVVDAKGRTVAGATLVALPSVDWWSSARQDGTTAKSDESGRFDIALTDVAPTFRLFADAPGQGPGSVELVRPGDDVTVTLSASGSLTGRVTDLEGNAVGGARVRWIGILGEAALLVRETKGAEDGTYRLEGLPSPAVVERLRVSSYSSLNVVAEGFAPLTVHWVPQTDTSAFDLRVVRGATIEGVVTEGETGRPVPGARVLFWSFEHSDPAAPAGAGGISAARRTPLLGETTSDSEGRFRFTAVPGVGFHPMNPNAGGQRGVMAGYVTALAAGYGPGSDEVPVSRDGAKIDAAIKLWPTATIAGRVVDAKGRPLAGVEVFELTIERLPGWLPSDFPGAAPRSVRTDAEGRYRLGGVGATRAVPAKIHLYATTDALRRAMSNGAGPIELDVRGGDVAEAPDIVFAPQVASARVVVTDSGGTPVWGARVSFDQFSTEARSDRDGHLEFLFTYNRAGIPPKPVTLIVRADGFATTATPEFTPSTTDPPEVRVALAPGHRVAGRVVRADGTPVPGMQIDVTNAAVPLADISPPGGVPVGFSQQPPATMPRLVHYAYGSTQTDGTFDIRDLPEGPYALRATASRTMTATASGVATDATDVVLTIPATPAAPESRPTGSLDVTVSDEATGKAIVAAHALLFRAGEDGSRTWVNGDGSAGSAAEKWSNLAPGKWTIRAEAMGYVPAEIEVTVGDEPGHAAMKLARGATVHGKVSVAAGLERRDLSVFFVRAGKATEGGAPTGKVDAEGAYETPGLGPGRWRAEVWRPTPGEPIYVTDEITEVDVPAGGGDLRLDVRVVVGGVVFLTAPGERRDLPPAERGRFTLIDAAGREAYTGVVYSPGMQHELHVRAGTYDVVLEMPGSERATTRVTVEAGGRATAKF